MAFHFVLKHTKKHQSVASIPFLKSVKHRVQIDAPLLSSRYLAAELWKRHITTSKPLASALAYKLQAPLATASVQELVYPPPYSFEYVERPHRDSSPRATNLPNKPSVKEDLIRISEVTERVDSNDLNSPRDPYWRKIGWWNEVTEKQFMNYVWQMQHAVQTQSGLIRILDCVLPDLIPRDPTDREKRTEHIKTREDFIQDVKDGMTVAPMSVRLTPHILSVIDWSNPLPDPVRRQFIPMKSTLLLDHPKLELDSLHESDDSPVPGLVHRYPDKALFLATSVCPVYCRFCTRSYSVGKDTPSNTKTSFRPTPTRWEKMFRYIEQTPTLTDIVVSGGDSYLLQPRQIEDIGNRLLSIPHIRRFRFATKGLAICPSRIIDPTDDWTNKLIELSNKGKQMGKAVAVHTHFNHPNEITWITRMAAQRLFENGVMVRNQSVLLRGVNDSAEVMGKLIRDLADINILPYYVYQGDMVRGVEDLRTPLQTILDIECQIRGSIAGFLTPQFVVDLPGGGGKRLAASKLSYDRKTGVSTFVAPAVNKKKGSGEEKVFKYYDPLWSLEK